MGQEAVMLAQHTAARQRMAALRTRGRHANAEIPSGASDGSPVAVDRLRERSSADIDSAAKALEQASGLKAAGAWALSNLQYTPLGYPVARLANYLRWRSIGKSLDEAREELAAGDKAQSEIEKRTRYLRASELARKAAPEIAREATAGKTDVIKPAVQPLVDGIKDGLGFAGVAAALAVGAFLLGSARR